MREMPHSKWPLPTSVFAVSVPEAGQLAWCNPTQAVRYDQRTPRDTALRADGAAYLASEADESGKMSLLRDFAAQTPHSHQALTSLRPMRFITTGASNRPAWTFHRQCSRPPSTAPSRIPDMPRTRPASAEYGRGRLVEAEAAKGSVDRRERNGDLSDQRRKSCPRRG